MAGTRNCCGWLSSPPCRVWPARDIQEEFPEIGTFFILCFNFRWNEPIPLKDPYLRGSSWAIALFAKDIYIRRKIWSYTDKRSICLFFTYQQILRIAYLKSQPFLSPILNPQRKQISVYTLSFTWEIFCLLQSV